MAYVGDRPLMAAWLYRDPDSAYCMMEYVVAAPQSTHEERQNAFHELAEHIFAVARDLGAKIMHMAISSEKERFGEQLEAEGFQPTDRNVTLYLKTL